MYFVSSPSRLKKKVDNLLDTVEDLNKRLKTTHVKAHRLKRKVQSLAPVVSIKEKSQISSDCASLLETTFSGVPRELKNPHKNPGAYSKELRTFAMTLKFYSAKAYKYARRCFDLRLPDPPTMVQHYLWRAGFT